MMDGFDIINELQNIFEVKDITTLKEYLKQLRDILQTFPGGDKILLKFDENHKKNNIKNIEKSEVIGSCIGLIFKLFDCDIKYSIFKKNDIFLDYERKYLTETINEENELLDDFIKYYLDYIFMKENSVAYKLFVILIHLTGECDYDWIEEYEDKIRREWRIYKGKHEDILFDNDDDRF